MALERPYHSKVAEKVRVGMRAGMWLGMVAGGVAAIANAFIIAGAAPMTALLSAPLIGIAGMAGGAVVGIMGGLLYGAIRFSPLFDRRRPEEDHLADLAALQQRVQDSLVPEQSLAVAAAREAPQQDRRFTEMIERERAARAATERPR